LLQWLNHFISGTETIKQMPEMPEDASPHPKLLSVFLPIGTILFLCGIFAFGLVKQMTRPFVALKAAVTLDRSLLHQTPVHEQTQQAITIGTCTAAV
jgi:hypothetical protein